MTTGPGVPEVEERKDGKVRLLIPNANLTAGFKEFVDLDPDQVATLVQQLTTAAANVGVDHG